MTNENITKFLSELHTNEELRTDVDMTHDILSNA